MTRGKHNFLYAFAASLLACMFMLSAKAPVPPVTKGHVACFVYHRFGDQRYPSTNISTQAFRAQLAYLKQNNFTVWPLGKAVEHLRQGKEIPCKTVVLTIDDAYHSFYENGLPLLEEFGYPATLFVNTRYTDYEDYMNWEEIRDAEGRGIEIGNHSHSHAHFLDIRWDNEREKAFLSDLATAHEEFNEHLGFTPELYSYPYGEYDKVMADMLEDAGYAGAAAQYSGILYNQTSLMEIPRFPMGGPYASLKGFIQKSHMYPMQLLQKNPENVIIQHNPPTLEITLGNDCINAEHLQCFVDGERNCIMELQEGPDFIRMKITARDRLKGRRSLYTITAPSKDGKGWCWYSHLWVNTEIAEE